MIGRILPEWPSPPPTWLTPEHWSAVALMDFGDEPFTISEQRPTCMMSAVLTCRREAFHATGGFDTSFLRCEDHEFTLRVLRTGAESIYAPWITVYAPIDPVRMRKRYHRGWHYERGWYLARMQEPPATRIMGIPRYRVREVLRHARRYIASMAVLDFDQAFTHETQVREFAGYTASRMRSLIRAQPATTGSAATTGVPPAVLASRSRT